MNAEIFKRTEQTHLQAYYLTPTKRTDLAEYPSNGSCKKLTL